MTNDRKNPTERTEKKLARLLMASLVLLLATFVFSASVHAAEDYLAPQMAFKFSARMLDERTAEVSYDIADGYYMYRERFDFKTEGARQGTPVIPPGKVKFDETFQKNVETYRNAVTIRIPVEASGAFTITATSQGCADAGLCYPPMASSVRLTPGFSRAGAILPVESSGLSTDTETRRIEASLNSGKLLAIIPLFLLLGLALAFTPCVLPMIPILSSIIVGDRSSASRGHGLLLSVAYAFGMAIVYTLLGVAAGLAGEGLAAALQNAWVLGAFALLMVILSLSTFGFYQLQMPTAIQMKLAQASAKQRAGKFAGAFIMGALSALIVGPCVAAPLAGVLIYISHTRDVLIGGSALFAMAVGMSTPLLLVGASAGTLLPRAGVWMESVKRFFGMLMLATALWLISPVLAPVLQLLGWAALGIGYAAYLFSPPGGWAKKALALAFATLGVMQLVGAISGGHDVLAPLAHLGGEQEEAIKFQRIKSVGELNTILANTQSQTVMLDFYADWCVSCKEMEMFTYSDSRVKAQLSNLLLLQADVTANNTDDKALLKRFNLFGPPGIIFFDKSGREISDSRVIGFQNAEKFLGSLSRIHQR